MAIAKGAHPSFPETRAARGELQFDAWEGATPTSARWLELREKVQKHGLRNSLLVAIAPTATIASSRRAATNASSRRYRTCSSARPCRVISCMLNKYLINELKARGLWNDGVRSRLKMAEGSVQGLG